MVSRLLETPRAQAGLSLLFGAGNRPSPGDVERLFGSVAPSGQRARVSHRPDAEDGWLELLSNGLTFDVSGLIPAESDHLPAMEHQFGIAFDPAKFRFETVTIVPGEHIASGRAMLPVVRAMVGLAARLALPLCAMAVCWHPARSWMEPRYFTRIADNWLVGDVFPALGLTAVKVGADGAAESSGLAFFVDQEIRVDALRDEPEAETVKLAVRVIDHIVRYGRLTSVSEFQGPSGQIMLAEPSRDGRAVRVRRSA